MDILIRKFIYVNASSSRVPKSVPFKPLIGELNVVRHFLLRAALDDETAHSVGTVLARLVDLPWLTDLEVIDHVLFVALVGNARQCANRGVHEHPANHVRDFRLSVAPVHALLDDLFVRERVLTLCLTERLGDVNVKQLDHLAQDLATARATSDFAEHNLVVGSVPRLAVE